MNSMKASRGNPMNHLNVKLVTVLILAFSTAGCEKLVPALETKPKKAEVIGKTQLEEARAQLPKLVDEYTSLVRIEQNATGSLDFWYQLNDEGTRLFRKLGKQSLRERADQVVDTHKGALDFASTGATVHHIYESKYGTHMLSFTVSPESIEGKETIGQPQSNPYAIRTVSANESK